MWTSGDVVGGSGDQRCGGEFIEFVIGEVADLAEYILAEIPRNASCHTGSNQGNQHRGKSAAQGNGQHNQPVINHIMGLNAAYIHA